jgi:hypothetical protein
MTVVSLSAVASALFATRELSPGARRFGADLLGSAAGFFGMLTESVDDLASRAGVSWNRARVLLGELSRAGFITYWSYTAAGCRWCCVSWLAWVVGTPRVAPPAEAGEDFTRNVSGEVVVSPVSTGNVSGERVSDDSGRSGEIGASVVVVVKQTNSGCLDKKQTTTAGAHAHVGVSAPAPSGPKGVTENVSGDPDADRIMALLTDPEVAMPAAMARRSASYGDFWRVVGNVFEWRRQRDAGSLRSPHAALAYRLLNGWEGLILDRDRDSELWERHCRPALADADTGNVSGESGDAELTELNGVADTEAPPDPVHGHTRNVSGVPKATAMLAAPIDTQNVSGDSQPAAVWWKQVMAEFAIEAGGTYDRWLHGTTVVAHDPELNSFVVTVPDRFRIDWLRNRLACCVARKLAVMTGRAASVNFILAEEELREAA